MKTLTAKEQQNAGGNSNNNNSPANHSAWIMMNSNTNVIAIQNLTRNTQYAIAVRARTSTGQLSPISETVLAWTDPSLPLEISQPFIHPFPVIEGSMVTIRCESIGYPVPNMTIYINGLKTKSERTRIVHYSIDYVERNLTAIACQAVNEESRHPVQSFREVNVHCKRKKGDLFIYLFALLKWMLTVFCCFQPFRSRPDDHTVQGDEDCAEVQHCHAGVRVQRLPEAEDALPQGQRPGQSLQQQSRLSASQGMCCARLQSISQNLIH